MLPVLILQFVIFKGKESSLTMKKVQKPTDETITICVESRSVCYRCIGKLPVTCGVGVAGEEERSLKSAATTVTTQILTDHCFRTVGCRLCLRDHSHGSNSGCTFLKFI